jgi:hypothetical protein
VGAHRYAANVLRTLAIGRYRLGHGAAAGGAIWPSDARDAVAHATTPGRSDASTTVIVGPTGWDLPTRETRDILLSRVLGDRAGPIPFQFDAR